MEPNTLGEALRGSARRLGPRTALVQGDRRVSYAELDARSNQIANALLAAGLGRGARIAVLAKDSLETFQVIFGAAKAGLVYVGINWRLAPAEIAFILSDSGAELLFTSHDLLAKLEEIRPRFPQLRAVVGLDRDGELELAGLLGSQSDHDRELPVAPTDVVALLYTSGTTGHPKGVQLTHTTFFGLFEAMARVGYDWIGLSESDTSLLSLPAFHIGGLWWTVRNLVVGAQGILVENFIGWQVLELIQRHRITKVGMVPAMFQLVLLEPSCATANLESVTHVVYGGSPIPEPLLRAAMATFRRARFFQIYGLTETGNMAVCLRGSDHIFGVEGRLRSAGRALPGVRLRVTDAEGRPLESGRIGEIWIHSPARMVGYWNDPEATAQTLVDGWIRTGDAGYLDPDGYLFIQDRVKDMMIVAGENIYPAEIENALFGHPAVAEVAVIGVPDERWGEAIKAFVVLKPGAAATPLELQEHARRWIADFKLPRSFEFVDQLPRTPSGKVKKAELRAVYWQGRERQV